MDFRSIVFRLVIAVVIVVSSLVVTDNLLFDSMDVELNTRTTFRDGLRAHNTELLSIKANLTQLAEELKIANERYNTLKPLIPSEAELPTIFTWLGERAVARNIKLELFSRNNEAATISNKPIVEIPVRVEVFGDFYALTRYADDLTRYERVLKIVSVKMVQEKVQLVANVDDAQFDDKRQNPYRPGREAVATTHATITFIAYLARNEVKESNQLSQK